MALEGLAHEGEGGSLGPRVGDVAFQNLAFMAHRAPEVDHLAVQLHVHLAEMPAQCLKPRMRLTRCRRMSVANIGPKRFHQSRTVSWQTSIPRSKSRSSTLRNDSGNRTYNITASRMISGEELK